MFTKVPGFLSHCHASEGVPCNGAAFARLPRLLVKKLRSCWAVLLDEASTPAKIYNALLDEEERLKGTNMDKPLASFSYPGYQQ